MPGKIDEAVFTTVEVEARASMFIGAKTVRESQCAGPVKPVPASFTGRNVPESSFLHCGGLVKLVPACLSGRKDQESRFHHFGGPTKLVQACLSGRKDQKRKFHPCGGPVKLVPACLSGRKELHDLHRTSSVEKTVRSSIPTC